MITFRPTSIRLCVKSLETGQEIYQSCLNDGGTLTFDLFYGEVKFASLCICMGPIPLYWKKVENYKPLSTSPMLLKFHMEPPRGRGRKIAKMVAVH